MTLNLGILGYGGMGTWHRNNACHVEGVNVVAAYDIDPDRVDAAKKSGLHGYNTLESFLKADEINTVLVSTPNYVHKELAIAAANAGKNVIVEKPAALSVAEFDEMVAAAKENHVVFTAHQNRRWDKDYYTARKVFRDNMLGDVFTIESRLHGSGGLIHGWRAKKEYGGGMVYDWGVHFLDQILYMVPNKVKTVYAKLYSVINPEVDDYFKIILTFDNGMSAQIELGTFCLKSLPRWFMCGNRGTMVIDNFECEGSITRVKKLAEKVAPVIVQTKAGPTRTFAPQPPETKETIALPKVDVKWEDFYRNVSNVIDGKEELIVKPSEVRRVLSLMEVVFKSHRLGKSIDTDI
ncbi:MAG TPA: gfo/Idh/MocA family oxidoreductase [Clostridiaceae bacterium]|nr:gfo/Idh/MocA family oxidoreductase [Clostridiaceae bacterium]